MEERNYAIYVNQKVPLKAKPKTDKEKEKIIATMARADVSSNSIAALISAPYSYAWSPSIFHGMPSNKSWTRQDAIVLDIDNKVDILVEEELIQKCQVLELVPNLIYETFSSTPERPKYRVVFLLSEPFTLENAHIRDKVVNIIHDIFPADKSCASRSSIFWGGKTNVRILNHEPNNTNDFVEKVLCWGMMQDGNRTRLLGCFASDDRRGGVDGENPNFYININNRSCEISPITSSRKPDKKSRWKISEARKRIKAFDRFLSGEKLLHNELKMIATNLYWREGGEKVWKNVFENFGDVYEPSKVCIFMYCKYYQYPPMWISSNSESIEDIGLHDTFAGLLSNERGKVSVKKSIDLISLQDAEEKLRNTLQQIMHSKDSDIIHLVICPTGVGKSENIKNLKATIALPTHTLKNELSGRMSHEHTISPNEIVFMSEDLNRRLHRNYAIGLASKSSELIHEVANAPKGMHVDVQDKNIAQLHIRQLEDCRTTSSTILTTHARSFQNEFCHDTLIYDEDPFSELVAVKSFSFEQLASICGVGLLLKKDSEVSKVIRYLDTCKIGTPISTPELDINKDALLDEMTSTWGDKPNLFEFFESKYFIIEQTKNGKLVSFVIQKEFPTNKKIVILSATASEFIYRRLFGDRLIVHHIGDVKQKGEIIQYTRRSCSRKGLSSYHNLISKHLDTIEHEAVITFQKLKGLFSKHDKHTHFGNCSGYDHLKGKNIAIVGTPHHNNALYFLLGKVLGLEWKEKDGNMKMQKVQHQGMEFKFHTFPHEGLRALHMGLVEGELLQAVGRARTVRTDAKVHLFSNLPLRIASRYVF